MCGELCNVFRAPPLWLVFDGLLGMQITKLPAEVQKESAQEAIRANQLAKREQQLRNEGKTRMKGKNSASKRHRKRQNNIIEVREHIAQAHTIHKYTFR